MEYLIVAAFPVAFFCLVSGIFTAVVAHSKQRSTADWFVAGALFPLLSLIAIAGMPVKPPKPVSAPMPWSRAAKTMMLVIIVGSLIMVAVSFALN